MAAPKPRLAACAAAASGPVDVFVADMSDQSQVRVMAAEILQRLPRIDVLVNNVGGFWNTRHVTTDGLERTFALLAVVLALVVDVLRDPDSAANDLGVLNIAGALPRASAPAIASVILAVGGGSYAVLHAVAGVCALAAAAAIIPVTRVR